MRFVFTKVKKNGGWTKARVPPGNTSMTQANIIMHEKCDKSKSGINNNTSYSITVGA